MARRTSTEVDGLAVYLRPATTGPAPAPRVVLVHGSMDRAAAFLPANRSLEDMDVVLYDRRGYGRSGPVEPTSGIAGQVDDLCRVLGGTPAVVVGHSSGGLVALAAASARPDLVPAVGVYETPAPWLPGADAPAPIPVAGRDPEDVAEAFMRRMLGDELWERLPDATRRQRRAEGRGLVVDIAVMHSDPPPVDLASISVPVIVGRGSEAAPRHRRAAEAMADALGAELVVLDGADHGGHRSRPEAFAGFVRQAVGLS